MKTEIPLTVHGKQTMLATLEILVDNGFICEIRKLPNEATYEIQFGTAD